MDPSALSILGSNPKLFSTACFNCNSEKYKNKQKRTEFIPYLERSTSRETEQTALGNLRSANLETKVYSKNLNVGEQKEERFFESKKYFFQTFFSLVALSRPPASGFSFPAKMSISIFKIWPQVERGRGCRGLRPPSSVFFNKKWAILGLFSFIFGQQLYNLENDPSSMLWYDSNSRPRDCQSPPITTKPGPATPFIFDKTTLTGCRHIVT